jgi:hypothetical protein
VSAGENGYGQRSAAARYAEGERAARANLRAGIAAQALAASCPPGAMIDWAGGYRDEANRLARSPEWASQVLAGAG